MAASIATPTALADVRWKSLRVDADLLADGTLELTERHILAAAGSSFTASRPLDVRAPAIAELVDLVAVEPGGAERKLEEGSVADGDRYQIVDGRLTWSLSPAWSAPWDAPRELAYRLRWRVHGAVTPVWAPRPASRLMAASPGGVRLADRWRETREALKRAGPAPLRRYVLDVNLAGAGREGPVEALDYGLAGDSSWSFAGNFMFVSLDAALPPGEGVDVSFLFDRPAGDRPGGVDLLFPAALVALALLPLPAAAVLLAKALLAGRRREPAGGTPAGPLPDRVEALSPEILASLLGESDPRTPTAGEVWARLRNENAVVVDRQDPPNLVLRADPADLRPPEAALVGALFGGRGGMPLAEARDAVSRLGGRLDEAVGAAFASEYQLWAGEEERFAKAPSVPGRDLADLVPVALVFVLVPLALGNASLLEKGAGVVATLAVAAGLFLAARRVRKAGFASLSALVPAALSPVLCVGLFAVSWLDPAPPSDLFRAMLLSGTALLVLKAGFVGARQGEARPASPISRWALDVREALRERHLRRGGEVDPAEAPWLRAAGFEVSLSEAGVADSDLEDLLGYGPGEGG